MQSVYEMEVSEAVGMVPVVREDYVAAAFVEPHSMDIDVHAIHHGYLKGIATRGGEVVTDAELTRLVRAQGSSVAETRAGAFAAPVVVNAAGAWCDAVAELAGVRPIGLVPKRRTPGDGVRRDRTGHERPPAGRPHCARTHIRRSLPWPFAGGLIRFPADLFGPRSSTSSLFDKLGVRPFDALKTGPHSALDTGRRFLFVVDSADLTVSLRALNKCG